jgi:hypothetical protein
MDRELAQGLDLLRLVQLVTTCNLMLVRDACILAILSRLSGIPQRFAIACSMDIALGRRGRQHDLGVFDSTATGVIEDLTEPAIVESLSGTIGRPGRVENPKYADTPWTNTHSMRPPTVRLTHDHVASIRTEPDHPVASAQRRATRAKSPAETHPAPP